MYEDVLLSSAIRYGTPVVRETANQKGGTIAFILLIIISIATWWWIEKQPIISTRCNCADCVAERRYNKNIQFEAFKPSKKLLKKYNIKTINGEYTFKEKMG